MAIVIRIEKKRYYEKSNRWGVIYRMYNDIEYREIDILLPESVDPAAYGDDNKIELFQSPDSVVITIDDFDESTRWTNHFNQLKNAGALTSNQRDVLYANVLSDLVKSKLRERNQIEDIE